MQRLRGRRNYSCLIWFVQPAFASHSSHDLNSCAGSEFKKLVCLVQLLTLFLLTLIPCFNPFGPWTDCLQTSLYSRCLRNSYICAAQLEPASHVSPGPRSRIHPTGTNPCLELRVQLAVLQIIQKNSSETCSRALAGANKNIV